MYKVVDLFCGCGGLCKLLPGAVHQGIQLIHIVLLGEMGACVKNKGQRFFKPWPLLIVRETLSYQ